VSRASRLGDGLADRANSVVQVVGRATPVPLGVRCGVFLAGLLAITVAYPGWVLFNRPGVLLLLLPVLPAVRPRGRFPTLVALVAVVGWLVATTAGAERVDLLGLLVLAAALYLLHSLAALAAVLPYDALVQPQVVARWVGRALAVVLGSAVLAIIVLAAAGRTGQGAGLAAALLGLGVAAALPGLLAWLWRRRPSR
jgi:hypothetical protein